MKKCNICHQNNQSAPPFHVSLDPVPCETCREGPQPKERSVTSEILDALLRGMTRGLMD